MELPNPHEIVKAQPRRLNEEIKEAEYLDKEAYALDLLYKMKTYVQHHRNDFQQVYSPSDDIYGETRSGIDRRPAYKDLEALANETCGFGWQLTKGLSADAVRNGFELVDYNGNVHAKPNMFKWCVSSDFYNQLEDWVRYDRIYGIGFLLKYYGRNDKYDRTAPKRPPKSFQAFPPSILTPINLTDSNKLDYDSDVWEFMGGRTETVHIHRTRIHVLCCRPNPYDWRGYSIFEPMYLSASGYLNLIINGIKMMAKYGNVVTSFTMNEENPSLEMYQEYEELINEFKAAYTFILGQGEEIQFQDTKMSNGINEIAEFFKEDISSCSGVPLNQLFGRAVSGGIGGAGALTSERGKIQTISNIQHDISYDTWKVLNACGWNLAGLMVRYRLDLQKTEMAKKEERQMDLQNFILEEQLKTLQLNNIGLALQMKQQIDHPELIMAALTGANGNERNRQLPNKTGSNPTGKANEAVGNGKQSASKNDEKSALLGRAKRNQDFLNDSIDLINKIMNQFKKNGGNN